MIAEFITAHPFLTLFLGSCVGAWAIWKLAPGALDVEEMFDDHS